MASPTPIKTATRIVRREGAAARQIEADICVVGAGSAGISAAREAARLGRQALCWSTGCTRSVGRRSIR